MEKPKVGCGFGVMILRNNKVLLGQRHTDPIKADSALNGEGTWTMPGGKFEFGESFEEGAVREVFEETGVSINKEDISVISLSNDIVPTAHFVTIGMLCEKYDHEPTVTEPDEITKWEWFDLDNLPQPLFEPSRKIIENYKSSNFYKRK
jgi:8-oxo-dGTP diphosphatase